MSDHLPYPGSPRASPPPVPSLDARHTRPLHTRRCGDTWRVRRRLRMYRNTLSEQSDRLLAPVLNEGPPCVSRLRLSRMHHAPRSSECEIGRYPGPPDPHVLLLWSGVMRRVSSIAEYVSIERLGQCERGKCT